MDEKASFTSNEKMRSRLRDFTEWRILIIIFFSSVIRQTRQMIKSNCDQIRSDNKVYILYHLCDKKCIGFHSTSLLNI